HRLLEERHVRRDHPPVRLLQLQRGAGGDRRSCLAGNGAHAGRPQADGRAPLEQVAAVHPLPVEVLTDHLEVLERHASVIAHALTPSLTRPARSNAHWSGFPTCKFLFDRPPFLTSPARRIYDTPSPIASDCRLTPAQRTSASDSSDSLVRSRSQ